MSYSFIPAEIREIIFRFLDYETLINFRQTNYENKEICDRIISQNYSEHDLFDYISCDLFQDNYELAFGATCLKMNNYVERYLRERGFAIIPLADESSYSPRYWELFRPGGSQIVYISFALVNKNRASVDINFLYTEYSLSIDIRIDNFDNYQWMDMIIDISLFTDAIDPLSQYLQLWNINLGDNLSDIFLKNFPLLLDRAKRLKLSRGIRSFLGKWAGEISGLICMRDILEIFRLHLRYEQINSKSA